MKKMIRGLTAATITFNNNDLTLRGDEEAGVDIANSEQDAEVNELVNAGLIEITDVLEDVMENVMDFDSLVMSEPPQESTANIKSAELQRIAELQLELNGLQVQLQALNLQHNDIKAENSILKVAMSAASDPVTPIANTTDSANTVIIDGDCGVTCDVKKEPVPSDECTTSKKRRGRPKGSKNKKKTDDAADVVDVVDVVDEVVAEVIAKDLAVLTPPEVEFSKSSSSKNDELGSRVVVGTDEGKAVEGNMRNSYAEGDEDDDSTRASIEAMAKLEAEERGEYEEGEEPLVIDESSLPAEERMGNPVVISVGKDPIKVPIVNSVLPEAEAIRNRDPFIDSDAPGDTRTDKPDAPDVDFIEANPNSGITDQTAPKSNEIVDTNSSDDDKSDAFIEV